LLRAIRDQRGSCPLQACRQKERRVAIALRKCQAIDLQAPKSVQPRVVCQVLEDRGPRLERVDRATPFQERGAQERVVADVGSDVEEDALSLQQAFEQA